MSGVLKPIATLQKSRGDRIIGYHEGQDVYVVMMWNGGRFITVPSGLEFKPTHWHPLPSPRSRG